jgi:formylglycine-generating enzyme required for sulfatase activity
MSGNVREWCMDWYGSYSASYQQDPMGANSGSYRASRGGSWNGNAANCRVAERQSGTPDYSNYDLGFRLVLP